MLYVECVVLIGVVLLILGFVEGFGVEFGLLVEVLSVIGVFVEIGVGCLLVVVGFVVMEGLYV